jgi:POT family proton-dependent oligopeptide transporter
MSGRFPPQIKFIVGNEAAERFSYYGMRAILVVFMTEWLLLEKQHAESVYHLFVFGVYFTPLVGAYLSDRFWGKYRTIITLSLVYIAGHAVLAVWESERGLYVGLALIAVGAGGIKPCVSAHVGDQFTVANKELVPKVFNAFYFSINVGSFIATLATPWTRAEFGPHVAFGIPGILMAIATFVFWLGRHYYIYVPPTGARSDTPGKVGWYALRNGVGGARTKYGDRPVDEMLAVLRVGWLFLPIVMWWALYDQTGSSWVLLTTEMDMHGFLEPDMLQAANPAMILLMIPLFVGFIYPALQRRGFRVSAVGRMRAGFFIISVSFLVVALLQELILRGHHLSAFWLLVPYLILTASEILVSITGLEFAYTQAPRSAKSTVMSMFYLTISFGNLITATIAQLNVFEGTGKFLFWAAAVAVVGVLFIFVSRGYREVEYIEEAEVA